MKLTGIFGTEHKAHRDRENPEWCPLCWGGVGGGGTGEGSSEGDKEVLREASNMFGKCHRLLGNRT